MGFAAFVSSSAGAGFMSPAARAAGMSAFARNATPWLAPLAGWLRARTPQRTSALRPLPQARVDPGERAGAAAVRPLRILRVADGSARQCAGRMVITGRMADVCAELDRLAARETQRHPQGRATGN